MDIASPTYEVCAYLKSFKQRANDKDPDNPYWFLNASLIVDKTSDPSKPFVFQWVDLLVVGSARRLLDNYESEKGANRAFGVDDTPRKAYQLRIKGYRVEKQDNPDYPYKVVGRVVNIDDLADL